MKLKKIASLALAGVMAVSMLAGCAGKTGTTEDGTKVEVTTSSIVTALNNGQSADNKAKVTFSSDAAFDAVAQKAVAVKGEGASESAVREAIATLTGKYANLSGQTVSYNDFANAAAGTDAYSVLIVKAYTEAYWTESTVAEAAARDADDMIAGLKADNKASTMKQGDTYYAYTYTGKATMVTVNEMDGTTTYYVVAAVTRTGAKATVGAN